MPKVNCKNGICTVNRLPKKSAKSGSNINLPGFPPNVQHTPQAAAQYQARQQAATAQIPSIVSNLSPLNNAQPQFQPSNMGQGVPQQYNPIASLQQQQAPIGQYGQQGPLNGPLQGLAQSGWYSPYAQQQQQQGIPQVQNSNPAFPRPTQSSTAIPQGQVIHPTGKQRGKVGRFFSGTRPQVYNNPLYNQYQNDVLNYLSQFGLEGLDYLDQNEPGNQFNFAPIGNQELERFYTQTVPSLAERFTSLGDGQRSSAFQGALANAGRGLGNDLAAQQQQYNMQQQQLAQNQYGMNQNLYTNLLNIGLRPQFESSLQPGKGGALPGLINAGVQGVKAFI